MAEATHTPSATPKSKAKTAPPIVPPAEPAFSGATTEVPAALHEFAEKGLSQAKDNYQKMKSAADEATTLLEDAYGRATKGAADYGLKLIEIARANSNAAFDFAGELVATRSPSEVVELWSAHARKQFEALSAQGRELAALAQKVAAEAAEPIREGVSRVVKKVA
jgi:phasin